MSIKKTLGMIVLTLTAGCATKPRVPQAEGPHTFTHPQLTAYEQRLHQINSDGKHSASEVAEIDATDKALNAGSVDDADKHAKDCLGHVRALYDENQKEGPKHLQFYFGMTGMNTQAFQNLPGNIGLTNPLESITGAYLIEKLGEKRAYELMAQVKQVEHFKGLKVKPGSVTEGGGYIQGLDIAARLTQDEAKMLLGDKLGRLDKSRFGELTDGKSENGEMQEFWLIGETQKGYALPVKK